MRNIYYYYYLKFILILLCSSGATNCYSQRQQKLDQFKSKLHRHYFPLLSSPSSLLKSEGRVINPIEYGGDPSGAQDSTEAIEKAVEEAVKIIKEKGNGFQLLPGIDDLGGAIVDLQGGTFKISKPIKFPPNSGNLVIQGGSLRASTTFPADAHLIELQSPTSANTKPHDTFSDTKDQNAAIYYEDITFRDILFDSSFIGGGLLVVDSARIRINNCFFLHFITEGILVVRGHETFISNSFLGEISTVGGDQREKTFNGTAIDLASNDNAVTDVVIFSAAIGIVLRGEANMITGVHCYNKATFFGGVGILVKSGNSRIDNCYLDYNSIVLHDPLQVHISNGFFLGGGNIVLKSINGRISGVNIINNMFSSVYDKSIVELDGSFASIDQVVVDQNNVNGRMVLKSTVGKMTVAGNGTRWTADFSSVLVFPKRINNVQYSIYESGGTMSRHAVTNVNDNVVVVESETQINGLVWFVVDQHT